MAYNVLDIAKKIIAKTDDEHGDTISNLKLQKMLYYMQGFHLAFFDTPLFDDDIVAWQYGPVIPIVYKEYKRYDSKAIKVPDTMEGILILEKEEEDVFNQVYNVYGQYTAVALMNMTHSEDPWISSGGMNCVISKDSLRDFFITKIKA